MNIVERIKTLCAAQNTTLKAIERELGISNGSIRNWDTSKPSVEKVRLVAEKFNVTIDWIITGRNTADLNPNEQKLVDIYRDTNDIGQPLIIQQASSIQKTLPRAQEQESSDFKIG